MVKKMKKGKFTAILSLALTGVLLFSEIPALAEETDLFGENALTEEAAAEETYQSEEEQSGSGSGEEQSAFGSGEEIPDEVSKDDDALIKEAVPGDADVPDKESASEETVNDASEEADDEVTETVSEETVSEEAAVSTAAGKTEVTSMSPSPKKEEVTSPKAIKKAKISYSKAECIFTGEAVTPVFTLKIGKKKYVQGTDFEVTYKDNDKPGKGSATLTGNGITLSGERTVTYNVMGMIRTDLTVVYKDGLPFETFRKGGAKPEVHVYSEDGRELTAGTDYTITYKNSTYMTCDPLGNPIKHKKDPTIVIKGKGYYRTPNKKKGIKLKYETGPQDITRLLVTVSNKKYGKKKTYYKKPAILFTDDDLTDQKLKYGSKNHYTLSYFEDPDYTEPISQKPMPGTIIYLKIKAAGKKYYGEILTQYEIIGEDIGPVPDNVHSVMDFGAVRNDGVDDTAAINNAIRAASENRDGKDTVWFPSGKFNVNPLCPNSDGNPGILLQNDVKIVMQKDTVLYVKGVSTSDYNVISAQYKKNIHISGGKIEGERSRHKGSGGECGHGLALYGSKDVTIDGLTVTGNWGDGIYLGTQQVRSEFLRSEDQHLASGEQTFMGCSDIEILNCKITNNRRNNISITDADDVLIEGCSISDAKGTAPQCGIYIEPNWDASGDKVCRNLSISNTTIKSYKKNDPLYMSFMTHYDPAREGVYLTSENITFTNCTLTGYFGNYSGKNLKLVNTKISGTKVDLSNLFAL